MSALSSLAHWATIGWLFANAFGRMGEMVCLLAGGNDRVERIWRACARLHQELWLFAPPGLLLIAVDSWNDGRAWLLPLYAWNLVCWWRDRNWPEDNHWKRRGKKARDAVKEIAGRLVVVPAGASS